MNRIHRLAATLLPLTVLLLVSAPAFAQTVAKAKNVNSLGGVMLGILLAVGVVAASFMSPRRTHQD